MSNVTPSKNDSALRYVVSAPKTSDVISGALRSAFARHDSQEDDFAALLRQIDLADREARRC